MRRLLTLCLTLCLVVANVSAQTLNVVTGNVTYTVPAAQAGNMFYAGGTTLTILGKSFNISDIDSIYIDNTEVSDGTVTVNYDDNSAAVVVSGNIMRYVNMNVSGAHVSIVQDSGLAEEIDYILSGKSSAGSFYMDGDYKAKITLKNLTLTNGDSAAINIENGKRIVIDVQGSNVLVDGANGPQKACFMVNGHSEFTGSGSLTITGNAKHGFWGDEYVQLKKTFTGSITIASAVKDGMNINQYFKMNNGTVTINSPGDDGIQVAATDNTDDEDNGQAIINGGTLTIAVAAVDSKGVNCDSMLTVSDDAGYKTHVNIICSGTAYAAKGLKSGGDMNITGGTIEISTAGKGVWDDDLSASACAALKGDGNINISGGTFTLTASGSGGKGINGDGTLTISGGDLTITTIGGLYYNNGTTENTNYTGNTENINDNYTSSPKSIKMDGNVYIQGGTITVNTSGYNAEGIESKAQLFITDGTVTVSSYDDAINSAGHLWVSGGTVTTRSANNDGLDANGNIYISGGKVAAFGASSPECGIDAAEGYGIYITGGTVLGVGGRSSTPSTTTGSQRYINTTGTVTASTTISLNSGTTTLAAFTVPANYTAGSSSGGSRPGSGQSGGTYIMISAPGMTSGTGYTLVSGSTSKTVSAM